MKAQKHYLFYFLSFILGMSFWTNADDFSLDNPFPENTYTRVLDICMQTWEDVQDINALQSDIDEQMVDDLLVGRLTRLQELIQQLPKESILDEDRECLQSVIDKITDEYRGTNVTVKNFLVSIPMLLHQN